MFRVKNKNNFYKYCSIVTLVGYGAACDAAKVCSNNSDCVNGTCDCSSGYYYSSSQCGKLKIAS